MPIVLPFSAIGRNHLGNPGYTAITLGEFLGWLNTGGKATNRLLTGLNALELIEIDCMQALHVAAATG